MKRIALGVSLLALVLLLLSGRADASKPFQPSYDIISISDSTPGGHGNVAQHLGAPLGDHVPGFLKYTLPVGWDIASVQSGMDEPVVGTGQLQVDVDRSNTGGLPCDGLPESYVLTIVDQGRDPQSPADVETEWVVQGYLFEQFTFVVKGSAATGQTIEALMFVVPPEVCTSISLDLTFQGISSENPFSPETGEAGRTVLTNPGAGVYTWSVQFKSKPLQVGGHEITRCDQVGVGAVATDTDADGIADTCDNCPSTTNPDQRDDDLDGVGNPCDPDDDNDAVCDVGGPFPDGTPGTPPGGCAAALAGSDQCPNTAPAAAVDANGCSQAQVDPDADGVCSPGKSSPSWCSGTDNCDITPNPGQEDWNANNIGDHCDDSDGDGWYDVEDNCRSLFNPTQADADADGFGNECDPCPSNPDCDADNVSDGPADPDGGGPIIAGPDNCPITPNSGQEDWNSNGVGDACDDSDSDGTVDALDNCRTTFNPGQENFDGDSMGDVCDPDDDNDTWTDIQEEGNPPGTGLFIGTGAKKPCALTTTADNEADDGLPPDFNDDRVIDITDIGALAGRFGAVSPPAYAPRFDLNLDGVIDITDIGFTAGRFGQTC